WQTPSSSAATLARFSALSLRASFVALAAALSAIRTTVSARPRDSALVTEASASACALPLAEARAWQRLARMKSVSLTRAEAAVPQAARVAAAAMARAAVRMGVSSKIDDSRVVAARPQFK